MFHFTQKLLLSLGLRMDEKRAELKLIHGGHEISEKRKCLSCVQVYTPCTPNTALHKEGSPQIIFVKE